MSMCGRNCILYTTYINIHSFHRFTTCFQIQPCMLTRTYSCVRFWICFTSQRHLSTKQVYMTLDLCRYCRFLTTPICLSLSLIAIGLRFTSHLLVSLVGRPVRPVLAYWTWRIDGLVKMSKGWSSCQLLVEYSIYQTVWLYVFVVDVF